MAPTTTRENGLFEFEGNEYKITDEENNNSILPSSPVSEFYRGKSIFITGATGFIGKVLIEKLLRCCSGVRTIYILLRSKKGQTPRQRLDVFLSSKVFDYVRKHDPTALCKVVAISGDIVLPGMGIQNQDLDLLIKEVSIVFHSAATVKFDEPLREAVEMNLLGTRKMVQFCHKLDHLEVFLHVSTAYANCDRKDVDELIYPMPMKPQAVIDMVEWMDDSLLNSITPQLLGNRPNTYTFTKALAENLLQEEAVGLPIVIVRPSIVTAAWKQPYPGWTDNVNGPTGLLAAISKGVIRSVILDVNCDADFIPVDVTINLMLVVAWKARCQGKGTSTGKEITVYNCSSGCVNTMSWSLIRDQAIPIMRKYPSAELYRYPAGSARLNRFSHNLAILTSHYLPAYVLDAISVVRGKKPKMVSLYTRIHKAFSSLEYFTTNQWKFHCQNVLKLHGELTPEDKKEFYFDVTDIHWYNYFETYIMGIRQFVLKEDNSTLPQARRNLKRMYLTGLATNSVAGLAFWKLVVSPCLTFFSVPTLLNFYQTSLTMMDNSTQPIMT